VSARRMVRGLAAIALIVAIIGGVPPLLLRLAGSPIPTHLPGWHHLGALLTQRDDTGSVFLALVRDLTWLAWLIFTVALVVELQAVARGRLAPRLHLGGIQGAAAKLAAIAALSFSAPTSFGIGSAGAVSAVALPVTIPGHDAVAARPAAAPATLATGETRIEYITVQPGDCLWTLAQRYLGAGEDYPEIANLNIGHVMDDGVVFTNPSLIYPGWQLAIPVPVAASPPAAVQQPPASHSGDSGQQSGAGQHAGHNTADPRFRASHPAASLAPSAGQSLASSASEAPAAGRHQAASAAESSRAHEEQVIAEGAAAALFAGGVLACLEALRRRQRNRRRPGRRIALPVDDVPQRVERDLRAADSFFGEPAAPPSLSLRTALQELAAALRASGRAVPECVGVHLVPDPPSLEILLTSPAGQPPAPFTLAPGRQEMCWQLDLASVRPESWRGVPGRVGDVLPGLFTVGTTTSGYLLLDLELMQVAVVRGEPAITDQFITTAAMEFATNQWSGWYDLVVAGPFTELEQLDRAEYCDTLDDALRLLRLRKHALTGRLGTTDGPLGPSRIRDLRLARPDDEDWGLTLLVGRIPPSPAQLEELVALADTCGGIAVLVPGWPDRAVSAPVTIDLGSNSPDPSEATATVRLGFLGAGHEIVVRPAMLTAAEYEALGSLFATAATVDDVAADEPPYTEFVTPPWLPRAVVDIAHQDGDDTAELAFDDAEPADVTAAGGWITSDAPADHAARAAVATVDDGVAVVPGEVDASSTSVREVVDGSAAAPTATAAAAPLRVGILGPVEITGTERRIADQQAELVVALALTAPAGLSAAALAALLGTDPSQPKPVAAVRQLITRTRRALGPSGSGDYYIRHDAGQYVLSAEAELDWAEFTQLFQAGLDSGDRGKLAAAMALVRGQPLDGSRYWWLDASVTEIITAQVVDASLRLAESQLADGDAAGAAATARTGLLADPAAEQLSRVLMRAEHAAGSQAGVTSAWAACHEAIQAVDPAGRPQEETTELYRALSGDDASRPIRIAG
jgi:DNA-binding SARP family transcriptional activator/LysM repeat protein